MAMIGRRPRLRDVMTAARETPSSQTTNTLRGLLDRIPGVENYTANKWANKATGLLQLGGFGPLAAADELWAQNQITVRDLKAGRRPSNLGAGAAALAGMIPGGGGMFGKGGKAASRLADFATDTPLYRGVADDAAWLSRSREGTLGPGVYVTPDPGFASEWAEGRAFGVRGTPAVYPLYARKGNYATADQFLAASKEASERLGVGMREADRIAAEDLRKQGFIGVRAKRGNTEEISIFDKEDLRSRFDR